MEASREVSKVGRLSGVDFWLFSLDFLSGRLPVFEQHTQSSCPGLYPSLVRVKAVFVRTAYGGTTLYILIVRTMYRGMSCSDIWESDDYGNL